MRNYGIPVAILQLLTAASAQKNHFFKWNSPRADLAADNVHRRQSPPLGYHPEFGACGSGTTCENACGPNWESCQASTNLSLFCYNKVDLKQTCCENGSGRACDDGFYCAWQEFGGKVWCCENGQSLEECGVPQSSSSTPGLPTSTESGSSSSRTSGSSTSTETSNTSTGTETLSTTGSCPAATVTRTVEFTITVAASTVTVTESGGECPASTSLSHTSTTHSTSGSGTITVPPLSSSTSHRPPINTTTTRTIATAGAGDLTVNPFGLALALLPLLWL